MTEYRVGKDNDGFYLIKEDEDSGRHICLTRDGKWANPFDYTGSPQQLVKVTSFKSSREPIGKLKNLVGKIRKKPNYKPTPRWPYRFVGE